MVGQALPVRTGVAPGFLSPVRGAAADAATLQGAKIAGGDFLPEVPGREPRLVIG